MSSGTAAGDGDAPTFSTLKQAFMNQKRGEQKAEKTLAGYRFGIQRLSEFFEEYDLSYQDIDRGTDWAVPLPSILQTMQEDDPSIDMSGAVAAGTLDSRDLLDYFLLWLRDDAGYATSTCTTTYYEVKPFLDWLWREGYVETEITHRFKLTRYVNYEDTEQAKYLDLRRKAIDEDEYELLREHAPAPSYRNRLIMQILGEGGLRREEVAQLSLSDLSLDDLSIDVPPVKIRRTKKPNPRTMYISESLRTNIEIWKEVKRKNYPAHHDSDALFLQDSAPNNLNSGRISADRITKMVHAAAVEAGIQETLYVDNNGNNRNRITPHSYRHRFAFACIDNGMDIYPLSKLMGHASVKTTEQYLAPDDDYLRRNMNNYGPI